MRQGTSNRYRPHPLDVAVTQLPRKSIPLPEGVDRIDPALPRPRVEPPSSLPGAAMGSEMFANLLRLEFVIHDFLAGLDHMNVPVMDVPRWANVERLRQILEYEPPKSRLRLGSPVLCGIGPAIGLESVLGFLGSLRKTGILCIRADGVTFMISIVRGDVANGVSNPRPEEELLGNILLQRGATDKDRLRHFFSECGPSAWRMSESLDRQELVSKMELRSALEIQLQQLFDRLLAAKTSEWCFHEGEATLSFINLRVNATSVLLESARKRDEAGMA